MNFEGIFKVKNNFYERVNGRYQKLNLIPRIYYSDKKGKYKDIKEKPLCKQEFKNTSEKYQFKKTYEDTSFEVLDYPEWIDYVYENRWQKQTPNPRIMYLDIEVMDLQNKKFPQPHIAEAPVTHIQITDSKTEKTIIIYMKEPSPELKKKYSDVTFIKCNSELEMFEKFEKVLSKLNPSIVTAYNGNLFDFPYLYFRSKIIGYNIDRLSPLGLTSVSVEFKNRNTDEFKKYYEWEKISKFLEENKNNLQDWKINSFKFDVKGTYYLDYMEILKNLTYEDLPSYKLEYVAYRYLKEGEGKVSYKDYNSIFEFYEKDYDGFFEYAIKDPIVLLNLEKKLYLLNTLTFLAYLMGCNYDTALATVQPWAIHLRNVALKENIILPNDTRHEMDKSILGGYVKEPIKGKHEWLFSFDFNSLYPSIMDMLNMCATTYVEYNELPDELKEIYDLFRDEDEEKLLNDENLQNKIKELTHRYNVTFNGQGFFRRDKRGMIAQVVADIYYNRKNEKQKMLFANAILKNKEGTKLSADDIINMIENGEINWDNVYDYVLINSEDIEKLETYSTQKKILQMALKIAINSLYGAISNTSFILFNRDIAAGITFVGRFLNRYTSKKIEKFLKETYNLENAIVYNDTDSGYVKFDKIVYKIFEKKFNNKSFNELNENEIKQLTDMILKFIETKIQPIIDEAVNEVQDILNAYHHGFVGAKVEKVMYSGIWVAKKKYAVMKLWDEGTYYINPTLSVTGLELVRSSTPEFAKEKFGEMLKIMLTKTEKDLQKYVKTLKSEFEKVAKNVDTVKNIARISSVSSLSYKKNSKGKYVKIKNNKELSAPINSRAAIIHNEFVVKNKLEEKYELIEEGNKLNYVYVKTPNPLGNENVFGFIDEKILLDSKLIDYIDIDTQYEKVIEQPIKIVSDVIGWELKRTSSLGSLF